MTVIPFPPQPDTTASQWTHPRLRDADELLAGLIDLERWRIAAFGAHDETSLTNLCSVIDDFLAVCTERQVEHLTGALALAVRKLAAK